MAMPSNIKPENRAAAPRFANQALDALGAVHTKWILREATRPDATALKQVNEHVRLLIATLDDATADHYAVAHDFGVIVAQLMVFNNEELLRPLMDVASARHKILGPRN
jgi:hypothetical protein